jgi:hypothetical protein
MTLRMSFATSHPATEDKRCKQLRGVIASDSTQSEKNANREANCSGMATPVKMRNETQWVPDTTSPILGRRSISSVTPKDFWYCVKCVELTRLNRKVLTCMHSTVDLVIIAVYFVAVIATDPTSGSVREAPRSLFAGRNAGWIAIGASSLQRTSRANTFSDWPNGLKSGLAVDSSSGWPS